MAKSKEPKNITVSYVVPESLAEEVAIVAAREKLSASYVARRALEEGMKKVYRTKGKHHHG
jgi:hypothetical protein